MSEKIQEIVFDNKPEEIEEAYKQFHNRYTLKKKLIYTVIYLIVVVLAADLVIKNPTAPAGYIAGGLGLGILVFNWVKPVLIRKKMMQGLADLGTDETYHMRLYDDRIEIETEIRPADAETETVAITSRGVIKVEEGSEAAREIAEHPEMVKDDTQIEKTVYMLANTEILLCDCKELLLMFVNRSFIHAIPKRCLNDVQVLDFKAYFEEKGLM
jgi:hypothetical protein